MSRLTIRPTATKPYSLPAEAMSPIATEADVSASAGTTSSTMLAYNDATYVAQDGGLFIVPTSDPLVVGALWNNVGVLTISAG